MNERLIRLLRQDAEQANRGCPAKGAARRRLQLAAKKSIVIEVVLLGVISDVR